jgi:hypothetical protein
MTDPPITSQSDFDRISVELSSRRTGMSFQRTRMSADRTLMSVIRTSLSLISFGFNHFPGIPEAAGRRHACPRGGRGFPRQHFVRIVRTDAGGSVARYIRV